MSDLIPQLIRESALNSPDTLATIHRLLDELDQLLREESLI
jgi:hypothetical protein